MPERPAAPDDAAAILPPPPPAPGSGTIRWAALRSPFTVGFFLTLGGLVAILVGMAVSNLSTVIIYVVFALFAALGLDPVVRLLQRRGMARPWGIVVVYAVFALLLAGILLLIVPTLVDQVAQFITGIPALIDGFQRSDAYAWLQETFGASINDLLTAVENFLVDPGNIAAIGGGVLQVGITIATGISGVIIVLVLSLYFLASLPTIKQSFYSLAPAYARPGVSSITDEITDSIGGYLIGMAMLAFFNATFAFILFLVLGLPFPLLMAVAAFCITLIPLIGPVLFWIVASVFALLTSPVSALIFAIAYLVYMQVEAYVLTPRVMNRAISIPGSLVVIGALVGGTLLGLLGALVAIPVTASVLLILKRVLIPRQDAKTSPV